MGLGELKDLSVELLRRAYASAITFCRRKRWLKVSLLLPRADEAWLKGIVEGALLANYSFDRRKKEPAPLVQELHLAFSTERLKAICKDVKTLSDAVCFTRDLVNHNADDIHPEALGSIAKKLSSKHLKVHVLSKKELEKKRWVCFLLLARAQSMTLPLSYYSISQTQHRKTALQSWVRGSRLIPAD
jgi:leucyl aminopeptidase